MDLKWWGIIIAGIVALGVAIALAAWLPVSAATRVVRPLAHAQRLTRLPGYVRVARMQFWSILVALVLLVVMFTVALWTSARPVGRSANFEAAHPEDIMLCIGEPVTDAATAGFLNYFAQQTETFTTTERIGLSSPTLRVVPMTRDYDFAATQFSRYAGLASLQQDLDSGQQIPTTGLADLRSGVGSFTRTVNYVDYARSVADILAFCMTGFPSFEDTSERRRSLIYLGYSSITNPQETRSALFTDQQVSDMAAAAGIQINVVARTDVVSSSTAAQDTLMSLANTSGGRFEPYNPAPDANTTIGGTDPTLATILDKIRANPPDVMLSDGLTVTEGSWDRPDALLILGLIAACLLGVSLGVLRR